jgi:hypothetical protein
VVVAQNDARPPDIHIGDVNQNTYITNVREGDVYVIQQQLALMQYMQMMGNPASVANAAYSAPTHTSHAAQGWSQHQPQNAQFRSTLTNLDNPWGYHFAPPHLVH